jgi:hypothetical protein
MNPNAPAAVIRFALVSTNPSPNAKLDAASRIRHSSSPRKRIM